MIKIIYKEFFETEYKLNLQIILQTRLRYSRLINLDKESEIIKQITRRRKKNQKKKEINGHMNKPDIMMIIENVKNHKKKRNSI